MKHAKRNPKREVMYDTLITFNKEDTGWYGLENWDVDEKEETARTDANEEDDEESQVSRI